MLSKCLNPHCSNKFLYLWQGHLYRIDYQDVQRRQAFLSGAAWSALSGRRECIEHFWLCERCSAMLTVEVGEDGEVCLIARGDAARAAAAAQEAPAYELMRGVA